MDSSFASVPVKSPQSEIERDSLLTGKWVLEKIEASGTFIIAKKKEGEKGIAYPVSSEGDANIEYEEIPLKKYMETQLIKGVTKFIFTDDKKFEFYRKENLKHNGSWKIQNDELDFMYENGLSKKNNIIKLNSSQLVITSESHGKPIILHFTKSK
ncbi:MAG: hypothetical protein COC01_01500 [Bacteroidetes bacterium]|nr:MAG: hypothetical protein COC01_01500 [Bacteroidota bacterium]